MWAMGWWEKAQVILGYVTGNQGQGLRSDTRSYMWKEQYLEYSLEEFIFPELDKLMNPQLS